MRDHLVKLISPAINIRLKDLLIDANWFQGRIEMFGGEVRVEWWRLGLEI